MSSILPDSARLDSGGSDYRRKAPGRVGLAVAGAALLMLTGVPLGASAEPRADRNLDFTLDDHEDIAARTDDGRLVVYPHSGAFDPADPATTYGAPVTINDGWNNADWVAAANTGFPGADVFAEVDGELSLYQHSQTWDPEAPENTLTEPTQVGGGGWNSFEEKTFADFDGTGSPDILGRDRADGHLYVFPTTINRDGSLDVGEKYLFGRDFGGYDQIDAGDLNGDGTPDVIARSGSVLYGFLTIAAPEGAEASTNVITISDGWDQSDLTELKDVNLDGAPDLVTRQAADGELLAFLNTSEGGVVSFTGRNDLGAMWASDNLIF